jgi:hypothetical protein
MIYLSKPIAGLINKTDNFFQDESNFDRLQLPGGHSNNSSPAASPERMSPYSSRNHDMFK